MDDAVIQTTDLRMRYAQGELSVEALRGVDFTVRAGEFVAIMGPSGSGKSTLLSILGCLERPTGGSYRIAGEEVAGFDESKAARVRRDRIGFVFQGFNLLLRSTAAQNVELPLFYAGIGRNERRERTRAALESVGLGERADHLPRQLSGGQQQRVAVARAIVSRPDVVLADEPTGNLDSTSQDEVLAVLGDVHARGATIVMVTHSREVAEHATRIVHVLDGLINADESLVAAAP
ncbi:MAG: putative transport system ATP-binding protein [Solirubrobacteraceae bacterium]|jgi:putative ABC transport system ATP-binding protein|nr:putative transport system ATP-binding protein [Solirubrobacteraceae bacterium]